MPAIQTYIPLYRKYRPQAFADVVGQEAVVQTLTNAIETNKVAHAYLLCGPRGTGKTSTARILAKSLNCAQGPTPAPCQACEACVGVINGAALDIVEIDAASNNSVENARDLIENCQFAPMAGRYKIYIIDEVHMLSTAAFNALLKTLEEPPPNVVFIFATTEAHKVLPTIVSRCQRFDFSRITVPQMVARLAQIAERESIGIASDALDVIARQARGGMRNALSLLDQVGVLSQADAQRVISPADVMGFIGALEADALASLTSAIADRDPATLLRTLNALMDRGIEPSLLVRDLTQHLRDLFLAAACGPQVEASQIGASADALPKLQQQAQAFSVEEYPQILQALSTLDRDLRRTQQPQLWLEIGLLDLTFRADVHTLKALADRVATLESGRAAGVSAVSPSPSPVRGPASQPSSSPMSPTRAMAPSPSVAASPASTSAPVTSASPPPTVASTTPAAQGLDWHALVASIPSVPLRAQLSQQAFLIGVDGVRVTIGTASEPILQALKREDKFFHIQKAVEAFMGRAMQVAIVLEKNRPTGASVPPPVASLPLASEPAIPTASSPSLPPEPTVITPSPEVAPPVTPASVDLAPAETSAPEPSPVLAAAASSQTQSLPPMMAAQDEEEDEPLASPMREAPRADAEDDFAEARKYTLELLQGKPLV